MPRQTGWSEFNCDGSSVTGSLPEDNGSVVRNVAPKC
jgi:hypothetical protein